MVNFKTILQTVEKNAKRSFTVKTMLVRAPETVEIFRRFTAPPVQAPVLPAVKKAPVRPASPPARSASRSTSPEPLPTRSVKSLVPLPEPVTSLVVQAPVTALDVQKPAAVPVLTQAPVPTQAPTDRKPKSKGADPLRLGIEVRDPMYAIATSQVRQTIECEEARTLESQIDTLYKSESGRSRGWTKAALEAYILPRAAAGLAVGPKDAFDWSAVATDKKAAAVLDFVCIAKNIRLAVWHEASREIAVWPAADRSKSTTSSPIPLYHVEEDGRFKHTGPLEIPTGWSLRSPPAFEHSLEKLTLSELDTVAAGVGLTGLTGKKADRVKAIGAARIQQRLFQTP